MASSASSPGRLLPVVPLASLMLLSSLLAALTPSFPCATAQIVQLTVHNDAVQPVNVASTAPVPGSSTSITLSPGGTGFLALDVADPAAVLLFHVGPDTYVLVSDNDMGRVLRDPRAATAGVTMTVSGPPCEGGQRGMQTVTAGMGGAVAKCAGMET